MSEADPKAILTQVRQILGPIADEPGSVLYSGLDTLRPGRLYVIGLNPGGDVEKSPDERKPIAQSLDDLRPTYNAYVDDEWGTPMQHRVQALFRHLAELGIQPRQTFTTNADFRRTKGDKDLRDVWNTWWTRGWPVNRLFLRQVRPRLILCLGFGPRSSFGLLQTPKHYLAGTKPIPRHWADRAVEHDPHGRWRVVRDVRLELDTGLHHQCSIVALPHPSRGNHAYAYTDDALRPFLTQIAPILAAAN